MRLTSAEQGEIFRECCVERGGCPSGWLVMLVDWLNKSACVRVLEWRGQKGGDEEEQEKKKEE
jgi:hypothetical protein